MEVKKFSPRGLLKAFFILYALISTFVTIIKADNLLSKDYSKISKHVSLDNSWEISINDDVYKDVSLKYFRFSAVTKGDYITMQRKLPDNWDIEEGVLRIHIRQAATRIFIDDSQIYEYGFDRAEKGKMIGSGYQFVNFPDAYKDKTIKIQLYITEDNVFTKFDLVNIYEWENVYRVLLTENRIPMFLGSFLVIFGISTSVITLFALITSMKFTRILCISLFSICMGLWTLCYYNVIIIFSIPLYSVSLMEYIALYLSPLPLTIYMYQDVKNLGRRALKYLYWLLVSAQLIIISVTIALHTADLVHFAATLKYMHILIICSLAYFFLILLMNIKSSKKEDFLFLIGMLIVGGCIVYDLIGYRRARYFGSGSFALKGISSTGVMIFIFILIAVFYIDITRKALQETERNSLLKSAYTDELTQLHNRRYCTEYMQKIQKSQICGYTVICFDLNNLKLMNDTYGHAQGDILIKSAADVIGATFSKYGVVARMGGDEFIAVLETSDNQKILALIDNFQQNIDNKNREKPGLNMSIAYGYASGGSQEDDIEKLYQIADDRMYIHKEEMKKAGLAAIR